MAIPTPPPITKTFFPSEIVEGKKVLVIGGGVGIAAILPIARELYHAGNEVTVVLGARTTALLILKDEFAQISHHLTLCTDDGSEGRKGFVTDAIKDLVAYRGVYDVGWAVGPTIMMKMCSEIAKQLDFPLWTSLNPIMVDGTGMCGGCRVLVGDEVFFACVDGPEFDGRLVDWDNLMLRQKQFKNEEADSYHHCRLEDQLNSR
ncbi:MAG TPA: sulfide/dihydroorotate dehydrogenase-like FAD/NAD-binding protein [Thermotogota bacterium]|nr:sulfide/dihydroorotate dehydrogenase-like FAD/NAD-binding protein [Thermotogota bacterium]